MKIWNIYFTEFIIKNKKYNNAILPISKNY